MGWKSILPKGVKISNLSFEECRNFKQYYQMLTQEVNGSKGFQIFYKYLHHLAFYALCCIQEKKFPALNNCWNELYPIFGNSEFDNDWLMICWICCDFPLEPNHQQTLLDDFANFILFSNGSDMAVQERQHYMQFHSIMKSSRLGLYQEKFSSAKVTKFQELFTRKGYQYSEKCAGV